MVMNANITNITENDFMTSVNNGANIVGKKVKEGYYQLVDIIRLIIGKDITNFTNKNKIAKKVPNLNEHINKFKETMKHFEISLARSELYHDEEFENFLTISSICFYLAKNKILFKKYFSLIGKMILMFCNTISLKTILNPKDYEKKFILFKKQLYACEDYFYDEIYEYTYHQWSKKELNEIIVKSLDIWDDTFDSSQFKQ